MQQPRSLKLTIKLKNDKTANNSLTISDQTTNVDEQQPVVRSPTSCQDQVDLTCTTELENPSIENQENQENKPESSGYQLVLYDPAVANGSVETEPVTYPRRQKNPFANRTPRILPTVGAFTVQCANCFKWRLIPTKEKYEEIREHIIEQPFYCETGREWRPDISCEDPPDITQDGSRLWAIDKPNIAQPPPGWQRLLRIRGEGSTKFADVYYVAPTGKRLRSMVEVQKYLTEHPKYTEEDGVRLSQFSFQIPRPLQENYVRKRPTARANGSLHPSEVRPIAWINPDEDGDKEISDADKELSDLSPETQPAKKQRTGDDLINKQSDEIKVEESQ